MPFSAGEPAVPTAAETSTETIGRFFRCAQPDPTRRARAIHDYVARLDCDNWPAFAPKPLVIRAPSFCFDCFSHEPSCRIKNENEVYPATFQTVARAAGLRVVTLDGLVILPGRSTVDDRPRQWNAVWIGGPDGAWQSIDVVWDRPRRRRDLSTQYFMPGEAVFARDHVAQEDPNNIPQPVDFDDELGAALR
jgi:hypothetical protein